MGSGSNGPYGGSGSGSGSQPYAPTYHVVEEMLNQDKQDQDKQNQDLLKIILLLKQVQQMLTQI